MKNSFTKNKTKIATLILVPSFFYLSFITSLENGTAYFIGSLLRITIIWSVVLGGIAYLVWRFGFRKREGLFLFIFSLIFLSAIVFEIGARAYITYTEKQINEIINTPEFKEKINDTAGRESDQTNPKFSGFSGFGHKTSEEADQVIQDFTYLDQLAHFSVTLPEGWEQSSKQAVDESVAIAREKTSATVPNYSAGFHLNTRNDFQYPYILIEIRKQEFPPYEEIEKALSSWSDERADKITSDYSQLLKGDFEKPFLDKSRNAIFSSIQGDVAGVGKMKGIIVMFLGKEGVVQFGFYSTAEEYEQYSPTFNSIINSFKYDEGFEFKSATAKSSSPWAEVIEKGISGGISGLFLVLLVFMFSFFSKNKNRNISTETPTAKSSSVFNFTQVVELSTTTIPVLLSFLLVYSIYNTQSGWVTISRLSFASILLSFLAFEVIRRITFDFRSKSGLTANEIAFSNAKKTKITPRLVDVVYRISILILLGYFVYDFFKWQRTDLMGMLYALNAYIAIICGMIVIFHTLLWIVLYVVLGEEHKRLNKTHSPYYHVTIFWVLLTFLVSSIVWVMAGS